MSPAGILKEIMASPSSIFSAYASFTAFLMLVRTMINDIVPRKVQAYLWLALCRIFKSKPPPQEHLRLVVPEFCDVSRKLNEIFGAAELYLSSQIGTNTDRLKISKASAKDPVVVRLVRTETFLDTYDGVELNWKLVIYHKSDTPSSSNNFGVSNKKKRFFELTFDKKHKEKVIGSYVPFVIEKSNELKDKARTLKMYTLNGQGKYYSNGAWSAVDLKHPSTFDTLAMEPELKKAMMNDLDRFLSRRAFYKRVGRAWKRGYLLYGPPGTGKSSLVAAMANHIKFDVYDLQLSNIHSDSELRNLLLDTGNRSILVIEDIDCSIDLPDRTATPDCIKKTSSSRSELTLSGLLNFIDGLWSSCGEERIIVFTTNHVEKLDPALLRPGRMDMRINMSYCTFNGFKVLASNYLGVPGDTEGNRQYGHFYTEIEGLMGETNVTPAEVAEEFMKSEDPIVALDAFVKLLKQRKMEDPDEKLEQVEDVTGDQNAKTEAEVAVEK